MTNTLVNTIKANINTNNTGAYAVVLTKRNFYTKKTHIAILTTVSTYEEANTLSNQLKAQYANELKATEAKITFATTDLFTRGYSYKFAKQ